MWDFHYGCNVGRNLQLLVRSFCKKLALRSESEYPGGFAVDIYDENKYGMEVTSPLTVLEPAFSDLYAFSRNVPVSLEEARY